MDRLNDLISAVNFIEEKITDELSVQKVSKRAYSSPYHFQRLFGIAFGVTVGEYIRSRRLSLAGNDLINKKLNVTQTAFKYRYETVESFSRAFYKFHGVLPSKVKRGSQLKSFSKLNLPVLNNGDKIMNYTILETPEITLVGYKKRFTGVPYGEERVKQEEAFMRSTRAKQWLLIGASCDYSTDYIVITNVDDSGYDFYVAYELDKWTRSALYDKNITGVEFMEDLQFEEITIPASSYAVFETGKQKRPIDSYVALREKIVEWLPSSNYEIKNAPELTLMHWRPNGEWAKERYIEIRIPIK